MTPLPNPGVILGDGQSTGFTLQLESLPCWMSDKVRYVCGLSHQLRQYLDSRASIANHTNTLVRKVILGIPPGRVGKMALE